MTEITKKRMRYEILEGVEEFLTRKIGELTRENEYNADPDNWCGADEMPEWRKEDVEQNTQKIKEIQDILKALAKM